MTQLKNANIADMTTTQGYDVSHEFSGKKCSFA